MCIFIFLQVIGFSPLVVAHPMFILTGMTWRSMDTWDVPVDQRNGDRSALHAFVPWVGPFVDADVPVGDSVVGSVRSTNFIPSMVASVSVHGHDESRRNAMFSMLRGNVPIPYAPWAWGCDK